MNSAKGIIEHLQLEPHPEGGFFKEVYRSEGTIEASCLPSNFEGSRHYSTAIYFLITSEDFSSFHKVNQDEGWHFYDGSPITLHIISPKGVYTQVSIGRDFSKGQVPQYIVPAHHWFAATVQEQNSFTLVGCTVAPGFDFADFELAKRDSLTALFPEHGTIIAQLTRS